MAKLKEVFKNGRVLLPVVHVVDLETTKENVRVACEAGADGVFLISHVLTASRLWEIYLEVRAAFPCLWIGINCLDLSPTDIFMAAPAGLNGVWVDDAGAYGAESDSRLEAVSAARNTTGHRDTTYFGGVALKYQMDVPLSELGEVTSRAASRIDVVTTSGPATGVAAPIEKIQIMKEALGDRPLALCSGVSIANVADYLQYVDAYLVASSICECDPSGVDMFVPDKVRELAEVIHS